MPIRKLLPVILSEAKNLCGPFNYEILRRLAPQNDIQKQRFRMATDEFRLEHSKIRILNLPFDSAQDRESFDSAQDREPVERPVEPFRVRPVEFRNADPPKAGFHRASASNFELIYIVNLILPFPRRSWR